MNKIIDLIFILHFYFFKRPGIKNGVKGKLAYSKPKGCGLKLAISQFALSFGLVIFDQLREGN